MNLSWLVGRRFHHLRIDISGSYFEFEPTAHLHVECPWRIVAQGRIVRASRDHNQRFGLPAPIDAADSAIQLLGSRRIRAFNVRDDVGDLTLEFEGGSMLEIWHDTSGFEGWSLGGEGQLIVAKPGGGLTVFTERANR